MQVLRVSPERLTVEEVMWNEREKRDIRALDAKIVELAKRVWRDHPNNKATKVA